jgi:hypothetical protein
MGNRFSQDATVRLLQRRLKILSGAENIEHELLNRGNGHFARLLASVAPAHTIRNQEQMPSTISKLNLLLRQTGLQDPQRAKQICNEEMILV